MVIALATPRYLRKRRRWPFLQRINILRSLTDATGNALATLLIPLINPAAEPAPVAHMQAIATINPERDNLVSADSCACAD